MTDLEAAARRIVERADDACRRIGDMCHEGRPPRMSVPAHPDEDDDLAIAGILTDAKALAADWLRLREDIAAAETSAIMWKARCEQAERQLAEARRALKHDQWAIIDRAIERYSAGEISDLHALGLVTNGFLALDQARAALDQHRQETK